MKKLNVFDVTAFAFLGKTVDILSRITGKIGGMIEENRKRRDKKKIMKQLKGVAKLTEYMLEEKQVKGDA